MGEPPERLLPTAPTPSAVEIVRQVSMIQSKYWQCMFPRGEAPLSSLEVPLGSGLTTVQRSAGENGAWRAIAWSEVTFSHSGGFAKCGRHHTGMAGQTSLR